MSGFMVLEAQLTSRLVLQKTGCFRAEADRMSIASAEISLHYISPLFPFASRERDTPPNFAHKG